MDLGILLAIIGILVSLVFGLIPIAKPRKKKISNTKQWRQTYLSNNLPEDFSEHYGKKIYIQPYITSTNPYSLPEPAKAQLKDKKLLKDYFIKEVFVKGSHEPKLLCILGDSGTGKTASLTHLFIDYINAHTEEDLPYHIRLVSLGRNNPFVQIDEIEQKDRCILLLDALDENQMAQDPSQYNQFMDKIEVYCDRFARVVITCRPQFFHNEQSEPGLTNVKWDGKWLAFKKCYLAPFDDNQVQQFLDSNISFRSSNALRQKAEEIVSKQPLIVIRPLVLTFIEDLAKSDKEVNTVLDVFDIIVEKWINRDVQFVSSADVEDRTKQWWTLLSDVASYMYKHQNLNITYQELNDLVSASHLTEQDKQHFPQRSLLTRSGDDYHFSHKSFYEYFMAYRFFFDFEEIGDLYAMDLQIYNDLFAAWVERRQLHFADLQELHPYQVAASHGSIGNRLQDLHQYSEAENKYQTSLNIFRLLDKIIPDTFTDDVATTLNNLAALHHDTNRHADAEQEYQEALTIRRQLADKNPDAYLPYVATTLNNLAALHYSTNRHADAEQEYQKALAIRRQLADKNPDAYLPYVAMTLNNLALLHSDTNRHADAKQEYQEALTAYRKLADKNPDAYLPNVAGTLNNLANLHYSTNRHADAEQEYQEALTIRRQLADKNPDAYLPDVATTLNNLALLHSDTNRHADAEQEYQEALTAYRKLADKNPDAYLPDVATTLNNLAILHRVTNRHADAEQEYQEALAIRRQLADKNPDAYLPDVAMTLNNLAALHSDTNRHDDAEQEYQEALTAYRKLADKNPDAYLPDVATTLNNLAILHRVTNRHADAEQEYQEALAIRRQLADKNPDAYLPNVATTLFNIARMYLDQGNYKAVEESAQESLEIFQIMASKSPEAFGPYVEKAKGLISYIKEQKKQQEQEHPSKPA